jgi:hypothetical protein
MRKAAIASATAASAGLARNYLAAFASSTAFA